MDKVKTLRVSKRPADIRVMIETDDAFGEELTEAITAIIQKENRRRLHGDGKGIGYRVELISSKNS